MTAVLLNCSSLSADVVRFEGFCACIIHLDFDLVLVDGVEVNNASQNDEFNWGNIIPTDIEKIEVIRGPQSSMFGSDAMAGVVNIITKRATTSKSTNVFSELGSFNSHKYGFSNGASKSNFDFRY